MPEKFSITTAIPYVNANPHVGFAMELIQADVLARLERLRGKDVFFLTGTDENALKNVQAAGKAGKPVKEFIDGYAKIFIELTKALNISNTDFIRTTEVRHIKGAQKFWRACESAGDIYKKKYKGLYCVGCEEFKTEKDLIDGLCPEHLEKPEEIEEENYFFKLSKYQDKIEKLITSDELRVVPTTRKNEALSFIRQGLQDFSISRSRERARNWGIPVPGDESQIIYVWYDALTWFINALGYSDDEEKFKSWWNDRNVDLIGKGINRFHTIYWPAMLISAGLIPPKEIYIHGYITIQGEKISKSLGNVVDPFELVKKYGVETVRYFLLREIPSDGDGDFSIERLEARYNADLANNLGNLVSRVVALIEKSFGGSFSYHRKLVSKEIDNKVIETWKKYNENINNFKLHIALENVFSLVDFANLYIDEHKPWSLGEQPERLNEVMTNLVVILLNVAWLLKPFLPGTSDRIFSILGADKDGKSWEEKPFQVKPEILFPKIQ
ncbi:MAG: methionine--tRNA ligase [Parcubacteria group bacterium]|nr:methionine--tRNA ligase [Parcubacteria group bacterium]